MKNVVILVILVVLGYFGYNAFNNSETVNQAAVNSQRAGQEGLEDLTGDLPVTQQGALVDFNAKIQANINDAKDAVAAAGVSANDFIEEGITDLVDSDVETKAEVTPSNGPGKYLAYEDVSLASLEGDIVLDFYASWCPSCRKLESDINNSLSDIPADLNIIVVNYDKETALKTKYGVTKQHTLVQVDQQGNLIKKWSGGSTLESIVANVE